MGKIYHRVNSGINILTVLIMMLPLLFGSVIYILLRPDEPVFFYWFKMIGLEHWLNLLRNNALISSLNFPDWVIYSLPNGLWAFACSFIIMVIWNGNKSLLKYFWFAALSLLVLGFELLQLSGMLPGTFCIEDLLLGAAGITLGIITAYKISI
jgi:hypothetical protein